MTETRIARGVAAPVASLGFIGLGHMGGNMAARLLAAGYTVYGEDRNREDAQPLVEAGLRWQDTPRRVAEAAEVVFTSLPDDRVLEEAASGTDGILAGLSAGKTWVDVSTVSPNASRALSGRALTQGARLLDAPVSGSVPQVQSGTLTIMVGGDADAYLRVEPILRELGTPTHIGDNGHGLALKLAINISLAVQMLAFAEGLLLAERSGVSPQRALEVMESSPIGSPMLRARAPLILDPPTDDAWFDVSFMHKDIELALAAARQLHIPLPTAERADLILEQAVALGYERRDLAVLFRALERIADTNRPGSS
jgi:3-hydroxyisobutyrate dehydrogenase-like beta-hydroxyacid dehydrogenase